MLFKGDLFIDNEARDAKIKAETQRRGRGRNSIKKMEKVVKWRALKNNKTTSLCRKSFQNIISYHKNFYLCNIARHFNINKRNKILLNIRCIKNNKLYIYDAFFNTNKNTR